MTAPESATPAPEAVPPISVVLVIYNRADVLRDTIDSILEQTFSDFELLLCDDCSTDASGAICEMYETKDERVRYLRWDENVGMPGNLNRGIAEARGRYVANLHDGDVYAPDLLESWFRALEACPSAGFVFNAYSYENPRGAHRVEVLDLAPCNRGSELLERFFFRRWRLNSPVFGTVMAPRSMLDDAGRFDERFGPLADVDMWMRLAEEHHVAYVARPLIHLPSKQRVPTQLRLDLAQKERWLETMYLDARLRHFPPGLHRRVELVRHYAFVTARRMLLPVVVAVRALVGDFWTTERP